MSFDRAKSTIECFRTKQKNSAFKWNEIVFVIPLHAADQLFSEIYEEMTQNEELRNVADN